MQLNEFIEATAKLETYYDKEYTKEKAQIMFEELKNITVERYRKLISATIRKCKYLPRLSDIFEAQLEIIENYGDDNKLQEKIECKKCKGSGYIVYKKKIDNGGIPLVYNMAAVCDCGNAEVYRGWETENNAHRTNYFTPTIQELGLKI